MHQLRVLFLMLCSIRIHNKIASKQLLKLLPICANGAMYLAWFIFGQLKCQIHAIETVLLQHRNSAVNKTILYFGGAFKETQIFQRMFLINISITANTEQYFQAWIFIFQAGHLSIVKHVQIDIQTEQCQRVVFNASVAINQMGTKLQRLFKVIIGELGKT